MARVAAEPLVEQVVPRPVLRHSGGGPCSPRRAAPPIEHGMLAMAVFLATEVMLFAGLISAFIVLRAGADAWPPPGQPRLPVAATGANTAVLLLSAYTMQRSIGACRAGRGLAGLRWLAATTALGAAFLLVQGVEWIRLIRYGLTMSSSVYGSTFYTLIGCHGLHVLAAVVALAVVLGQAVRGTVTVPRTRRRLEVCRLYWSFVVGIWPILYVLVYLG
jgi:heme/copper-type cytochrome/quinol oxidase subunit 3